MSQFKNNHPSENLKFNNLSIFQNSKLRISLEKFLLISLKLNFTPNTLVSNGLISWIWSVINDPSFLYGSLIDLDYLKSLYACQSVQSDYWAVLSASCRDCSPVTASNTHRTHAAPLCGSALRQGWLSQPESSPSHSWPVSLDIRQVKFVKPRWHSSTRSYLGPFVLHGNILWIQKDGTGNTWVFNSNYPSPKYWSEN